MNAYLDSNIIIYIENGDLDLKNLIETIDTGINKIFFSASHLQEADEIKGKTELERAQRIQKRVDTIERITSSNYIYEDLQNQIHFLIVKPSRVLETIREVPFANSSMKILANMISEEQRQEVRRNIGLDPFNLNNYSPDDVVVHFNEKLSAFGQAPSFLELIEIAVNSHPQGKSFGLSNRIAGIFELLDFFGYWKDVPTEKSNYARIWDSSHTFHASFTDYFISDDKRTRNKARVVYNIYDIKTKVLSSKGEE